jgi:RNA polymerase sigma-70 factor, ECF subfamily
VSTQNQASLNWGASPEVTSSASEEIAILIQRCLSGDETAYRVLYDRHAGLVYRLAYGLLQNREDAEEVLQDSFEYAFRKLADFDARRSAFSTWLYRITVSRCRNKRRRKWLATFPIALLSPGGIKDKDAPLPDEALELSELQSSVWAALGELSPKLRETAVLRYYHGLQYKEIGDILGVSPKTAESRMRLAHQKLREFLVAADSKSDTNQSQ